MKVNDEYLDFIMDKFRTLDVVSARKMFGGYVIHMAGKVLGFIFEDSFLFEPGPTIDRLLPDAPRRELFPGSKLFVVIDDSIGAQRLCSIAQACYDDFPLPKPRKKAKQSSAGKSVAMEREIKRREAARLEEERRRAIEARFPFAKLFED